VSQLARSPDRAFFCAAGQITVALADITAAHCQVADPPEIAQNQTMPIPIASFGDVAQHPNTSTRNTNVMARNVPNNSALQR
tara:strand:- start:3657 stop:3902 length:246 start_codon:yes stop_codon:yes gene_type:complete